MWGLGLELDRHHRPRVVPTEAERAKQAQEQRLAEIGDDAERNYRDFLRREYPDRAPARQLIAVELGPRAELWSEQNAGLPYHWEESDLRHPEGGIHLEGTAEGDGTCSAWPTRGVREAIREGWLIYRGPADSQNQRRRDITAEQAGDTLMSSLEMQFIRNTKLAIFLEWRDAEIRRCGSWLNVPLGSSLGEPPVWDAAMEAELQRRLQEYRRHSGHEW